jgi:hypothetical protein
MTSSSDIIKPIRLLRSSTASKRPIPNVLQSGQPSVNIEGSDPGLYFLNSDGDDIIKIGPCHVGNTAPNSSPVPGGYTGLSRGEMWLDTSPAGPPILKTWDGLQWVAFGFSLSNYLWVDKSGDDSNSGQSPNDPKLTIGGALSVATQGTTILVSPGTYEEDNPLNFPFSDISITGAGSGNTFIELSNDDDLFYVRDNCFVEDFCITGVPSSLRSIMSFSSLGAGDITKPPLIKNCINNVEGSVGITVDGVLADGVKTIRAENFIQKIPNGVGFSVFGAGFLEVESCETYFSETSILATSGGVATVSNSKSFYGDFGLVAEGVGPLEQSGEIAALDPTYSFLQVDNLTETLRPYDGQVLTVGGLYYEVSSFNITNQGIAYSSVPNVSVSVGTGPEAQAAEGLAVIENGKLVRIDLLSPGQGYKISDTVTVTITGGSPAVPATAEVVLSPLFYTVLSSTDIVGGSCVVEIAESLPYAPSLGSTVEFFRISKISANSHYMGYVGSGNLTPYEGGVPTFDSQIVEENGGRVYFSSMDQSGNFRVGKEFTINQITGEISGSAFIDSVLSTTLPYIKSFN